jgi:hypothetical protein
MALHHCGGCNRKLCKKFSNCGNCLRVAYCNAECQKQHFKIHKTVPTLSPHSTTQAFGSNPACTRTRTHTPDSNASVCGWQVCIPVDLAQHCHLLFVEVAHPHIAMVEILQQFVDECGSAVFPLPNHILDINLTVYGAEKIVARLTDCTMQLRRSDNGVRIRAKSDKRMTTIRVGSYVASVELSLQRHVTKEDKLVFVPGCFEDDETYPTHGNAW